jgi:catechol 2,3-dioxygenase-like lactoylglutathione lyase family enzyme
MSNPAFQFDHVHIISQDPQAAAKWYVEMFGARIAANTTARGAPQIFVDLGGMTILIRGRRPGEAPVSAREGLNNGRPQDWEA